MPRVSRRLKRKSAGYSEYHVMQLLEGFDLMDDAFGHGDLFDEPAAKTAWDLLGEQLLANWIAEHPTTRPWAWWRWQAPERRRRIDGGVHPHDNPDRSKYIANSDSPSFWKAAFALHFGLPTCFIPEFDGDLYHEWWKSKTEWATQTEIFESQAAYLQRHNLLTPAEKTKLFGGN